MNQSDTSIIICNIVIINQIQKEVLIGNILGDGYIKRIKFTHNPVLTIEQAFPKHEEHVNYLYTIYKNLTLSGPKIIYRKPDKRTGKIYNAIRFRTRALPCLIPIFELFYIPQEHGSYRKTIPENIHEYLTARGLAH
jgi:hypothetical protein